jgi:hypothetical protein
VRNYTGSSNVALRSDMRYALAFSYNRTSLDETPANSVSIGEVVTYIQVVLLPQGTTPSLNYTVVAPVGMEILRTSVVGYSSYVVPSLLTSGQAATNIQNSATTAFFRLAAELQRCSSDYSCCRRLRIPESFLSAHC